VTAADNESTRSVAIIPIKGFDRGKSRLSDVLPPHARRALTRRMFLRVLEAANQSSVSSVLVATDDDEVAAIATATKAHVLRDHPDHQGSLAQVVDAAIAHAATTLSCSEVLVLMGDLPQIQAADVQALKACLDEADLVLVPDRRGQSTNALALRTAHVFATCFGSTDSLAKHEVRGIQHRLRTVVMHNAGIAHDVDTRVDLDDMMVDC
jgi:2-phospho-L-lactate guanylyltransferase